MIESGNILKNIKTLDKIVGVRVDFFKVERQLQTTARLTYKSPGTLYLCYYLKGLKIKFQMISKIWLNLV